jgi:hypothetical protein
MSGPSEFPFTRPPVDIGQTTTTIHDDQAYGLFVYPMPGCYATSVKAQSGDKVPMQTTSNTMAWDKRQEDEIEYPTTVSWDYEHGTLYAQAQMVGYTVFQGTHTCYESCSSWLTYYYPDGTGGPMPSTVVVTTVSSAAGSITTGVGSGAEANTNTTSSGSAGATEVSTAGAGHRYWAELTYIAGCVAVATILLVRL